MYGMNHTNEEFVPTSWAPHRALHPQRYRAWRDANEEYFAECRAERKRRGFTAKGLPPFPVTVGSSGGAASHIGWLDHEQAAVISGQRPVMLDPHPWASLDTSVDTCGRRWIRPCGVAPPLCPGCDNDLEWNHQEWPPLNEGCRFCWIDDNIDLL